ncbi:CPBP family intramembrane glutamic endopeptidase [Microbacterium rhizomatis]|uniref:CPBP family intramembrane metalloprotease n=1 Tax=Microbacterium rhizomatis TaxID=1631477 RepID=A0A5J5IZV3_9MICO|nr:CPBP family intramembrane glutamic endopeptidase [Microbacterium rhizomatis]KAA9107785.1 CPBP family intramembrane metalloprotease [Microbacterium rhizomatis]
MTMTPDESPGSSSHLVPAPAYARPWPALLVAAVGFIAAALLIAGYPSIRLAWITTPSWVQSLLDLVILSLPLVVAVFAAAAVGSRLGIASALGIRAWRWSDVVAGAGIALVVRAAVELIAPTVGSITGPLSGGDAGAQAANAIIIVVGAALISPVVEETFFRGVVVRALGDGLRSVGPAIAGTVAVAVSTGAFVALHAVSWGASIPVAALVGTAGVGLGTSILVVLTGRLGGAIIAHIVFNTLGVVLLLL